MLRCAKQELGMHSIWKAPTAPSTSVAIMNIGNLGQKKVGGVTIGRDGFTWRTLRRYHCGGKPIANMFGTKWSFSTCAPSLSGENCHMQALHFLEHNVA